MNEPIKTKIEGSILEVTIDRPKANAIDANTSIILGDIFANFRDNPKLKVAIVIGDRYKKLGIEKLEGFDELFLLFE